MNIFSADLFICCSQYTFLSLNYSEKAEKTAAKGYCPILLPLRSAVLISLPCVSGSLTKYVPHSASDLLNQSSDRSIDICIPKYSGLHTSFEHVRNAEIRICNEFDICIPEFCWFHMSLERIWLIENQLFRKFRHMHCRILWNAYVIRACWSL